MKKIIYSDKAPNPVGPYSQAVFANNTLYISGQIAIVPETGEIDLSNIENETAQVMKNLGVILNANDMTYENVVRCTVFVRDMGLYSRINAVYAEFFEDETAPARALVEVAGLPKDVNIEISCIAVKA